MKIKTAMLIMLLSSCAGVAAQAASPDVATIGQLLAARSANFAQFQQDQVPDNTTTTKTWNASLRAFGMQCVIHNGSIVSNSYAYECATVAGAQDAARATKLDKQIQATFRTAVHGFTWWRVPGVPGIGNVPSELVGGLSPDGCYAEVQIDPKTNVVDVEIFASPFDKGELD
jgi:hypothetical protein